MPTVTISIAIPAAVTTGKKIGVSERPRSLNPGKAVAMPFALSLFVLLLRARALMHNECPDVHVSKLPVRKSRNIARDTMRVRAVNKHGRLLPAQVSLLLSMKVLQVESLEPNSLSSGF